MSLNPDHLAMLAASGIPEAFAAQRGYETVENITCLQALGLAKKAQTLVPGLMFPLLRADGTTSGWQFRPDNPRIRVASRSSTRCPGSQPNGVDVPPGFGPCSWIRPNCGSPRAARKRIALRLRGLCIVADRRLELAEQPPAAWRCRDWRDSS